MSSTKATASLNGDNAPNEEPSAMTYPRGSDGRCAGMRKDGHNCNSSGQAGGEVGPYLVALASPA